MKMASLETPSTVNNRYILADLVSCDFSIHLYRCIGSRYKMSWLYRSRRITRTSTTETRLWAQWAHWHYFCVKLICFMVQYWFKLDIPTKYQHLTNIMILIPTGRVLWYHYQYWWLIPNIHMYTRGFFSWVGISKIWWGIDAIFNPVSIFCIPCTRTLM